MMNRNLKIGQLVYIPSNVDLLKYEKRKKSKSSAPRKHLVLTEPTSLLVTEIMGDVLGVHYQGETWYVNQKDIYSN